MPVSIVVGGQFGSEGKGKIALELARRSAEPATVVRVGGPNSGHTGYDRSGTRHSLRQLPAGAIDRGVDVVFPAGAYIDPPILLSEMERLNYPRQQVLISPYARVITSAHKDWERAAGLLGEIGSTGSGVGGAVMASVARGAANFPLPAVMAEEISSLAPFLADTTEVLRSKIDRSYRVIIEGTQGFGLSLSDGGYWPKATARGTTAAAALAEAGLSPLDVDDITLVLRSFPIRVAGNSGPLPNETTWEHISSLTGGGRDLREFTTVTNRLRRVAFFDAELVRRAIAANRPTRIVVNHVDYIGSSLESDPVRAFLSNTERQLERRIDWVGFSGRNVVTNNMVAQ